MKHIRKINEEVESPNLDPRIESILLRLAEIVSAEIQGSSVHPSEDFNLKEIYTLLYGDRLEDILMSGITEYLKRKDDASIDRYDKADFYINPETLECSSRRRGGRRVYFHSIYGTIVDGEFDKIFVNQPDSIIKLQAFKDSMRRR
jgi:hypothetical protein